jgi:hypothetical protein
VTDTLGRVVVTDVVVEVVIEVETEVLVIVTVDAAPDDSTYAPAAATTATTITMAATAAVPTPCLLLNFIFILPALRTRYMARRIILLVNIVRDNKYGHPIIHCAEPG